MPSAKKPLVKPDPMNSELSNTQKPGDTRELLEPEHPSKVTKWTTKFFYLALVLIAIGVGVLLKWSFQDENVIRVNNEPFPVRTIREHPEANGVVILKVDFCKNVDTEGQLRMSFVSADREVLLPLIKERGIKGCNVAEVPVIIPEDLPPGQYQIRFRVVYNLNPLKRNIADEFTSQKFEVAPHQTNPQ